MSQHMTSQPPHSVDTVIFDLGNVLIQWNPRNLFRKIFGSDDVAMEHFLSEVCNTEWNEQQDRGRPWKDAIAEAVARHPAHESNIRAYFERWSEMIPGEMEGTVKILEQLRNLDVRLLALTNWSAETFHVAEARFPFLKWFEGIVVSGRERIMKPDPAIFRLISSVTSYAPRQRPLLTTVCATWKLRTERISAAFISRVQPNCVRHCRHSALHFRRRRRTWHLRKTSG